MDTIKTYLTYLEEVRKVSPYTVVSYAHDLRLFSQFLAQRELSVAEFTPLDARRYTAYIMREKKYKPATVNRMLSTLRGLYQYAIRYEVCTTNPFLRIAGNPRYRRLPEVLSRDDILRILSFPVHDFLSLRDSMMMHLFYSTGCRLAELLAANVGDVELSDERMLVHGKGNRQRYVFINPSTKKLLEDYLVQRRQYLEDHRDENIDLSALFIGSRGKRLSASTVHSIFTKYRIQLGLRTKFTPHMLRHSFATHMLDNDSSIRIVQELLGHASISTTQIYTHVSSARLHAVYERSHPHGRKKDGN